MTIEADRNIYLHFIDPCAAVAVYTDTYTHTLLYTSLAHAHAPRHNYAPAYMYCPTTPPLPGHTGEFDLKFWPHTIHVGDLTLPTV